MNPSIRIRFLDHDREVEAAVGDSILELALAHGIDLDHACGGVCACSTCHVKIVAGADLLTQASEEEEDQLDSARDLGLSSRLGCQAHIQAIPDGGGTIDVQIPSWNINLVQEG